MNPLLGDLAGNAQLIHKAAQAAFSQGAKLVVTPELSLTGYPPEDLLLRSHSFLVL
jgi:NAD+ synthase (glutamine-hydrolysing)